MSAGKGSKVLSPWARAHPHRHPRTIRRRSDCSRGPWAPPRARRVHHPARTCGPRCVARPWRAVRRARPSNRSSRIRGCTPRAITSRRLVPSSPWARRAPTPTVRASARDPSRASCARRPRACRRRPREFLIVANLIGHPLIISTKLVELVLTRIANY